MDINFESQKDKIIHELNRRVPSLTCPLCHQGEFSLGSGYFAHDIQKELRERQIGGVSMPVVPVVCRHCGFVMQFAAGTLGLLPKPEELKTEENAKK